VRGFSKKNDSELSKKVHPKIISSEDQKISEKVPPNDRIVRYKIINSDSESDPLHLSS